MKAASVSSVSGDASQPGTKNWSAVDDAIRARMRELKMTAMHLAQETRLSPTTIHYIGRPDGGQSESALVAISAVLRWRDDHLTNILHGQAGKNTAKIESAQPAPRQGRADPLQPRPP